MKVICSYKRYTTFEPKIVSRTLNKTNNYKPYYRKYHPEVLLEENNKKNKNKTPFFEKTQTAEKYYRELLTIWVINNNLSFSLIDQDDTKAFFKNIALILKYIYRP
jgi:hypothetical protein